MTTDITVGRVLPLARNKVVEEFLRGSKRFKCGVCGCTVQDKGMRERKMRFDGPRVDVCHF